MSMRRKIALATGVILLVALLALAAIAARGSVYHVDVDSQAVVLKLGKVDRVTRTPGWHFKLPFVELPVILPLEREERLTLAGASRGEEDIVAVMIFRYAIDEPDVFYRTVNNRTNMRARSQSFLRSAFIRQLQDTVYDDIDVGTLRDAIVAVVGPLFSQVGVSIASLEFESLDRR